MDHDSIELKKRGKSFFWASLFFSSHERKDVDILYSFCRYIDDIGDNGKFKSIKAKKLLNSIKKDISKEISNNKIIFNFIQISKKYNINKKIPIKLIEGIIQDLKNINFKKKSELLDYSFKVAGTVGMMMCSIMRVKEQAQLVHAVELGIAMQLTNISRDIIEDLNRNRIYIPAENRRFIFRSFSELRNNKFKQIKFSKDVIKIINHSDILYKYSQYGIYNLPLKYMLPILIASNLYQQIGKEIRKNPKKILKKRVFVSNYKKILISLKSILSCFLYIFNKKKLETVNPCIRRIIKDFK